MYANGFTRTHLLESFPQGGQVRLPPYEPQTVVLGSQLRDGHSSDGAVNLSSTAEPAGRSSGFRSSRFTHRSLRSSGISGTLSLGGAGRFLILPKENLQEAPSKGRPAGQAFVQHRANRIPVAALPDHTLRQKFRSHVGSGAADRLSFEAGLRRDIPNQPEIQKFDLSLAVTRILGGLISRCSIFLRCRWWTTSASCRIAERKRA